MKRWVSLLLDNCVNGILSKDIVHVGRSYCLLQGGALEVKNMINAGSSYIFCSCCTAERVCRRENRVLEMTWWFYVPFPGNDYFEFSDQFCSRFRLGGHDWCIECNDRNNYNQCDMVDMEYLAIVWLRRYSWLPLQHDENIIVKNQNLNKIYLIVFVKLKRTLSSSFTSHSNTL